MTSVRVAPGTTSQSVYVRVYKDTGWANATPLAYNASGLAVSYVRDNGSPVTITLASLSSAAAAYASGGWAHVGNGVYRLDLPNAAIASGATFVNVIVAEATDIRAESVLIDLDAATSTRSTFDAETTPVTLATAQRVKLDAAQPEYAPARAGDVQVTVTPTVNVAPTLTSDQATKLAAIPSNPLLANDARLPATGQHIATPGDVSPTIAFTPTITPPPVTVTPTFNVAVPDVIFTPTITPPAVTVNPTLTTQQAAQLATLATTLAALTQDADGSKQFRALALALAPTGSGSGPIIPGDLPVNHNTSGPDALRVVDAQGNGIDGATVLAYRESEYATGGRVVRDTSATGTDGRWLRDMMLDAGVYRFMFVRAGYASLSVVATVD